MKLVAVDGPSGAGKSTVARSLAEEMGATVVPTDHFATWDDPVAWWPRLLHGEHVLGLLHHADQRGVAAGVGAVAAALRRGDVAAHLAELHPLLDLLQHVLQP